MSNEIPAGRYLARAAGRAQFGGRPGAERMGVRFRLLNEGFEGRAVNWYQGLGANNPIGQEIAVRGLRDAGWTGDDITAADEDTGLGSVDVELAISHREYEGKTQLEVKVFGIGGGAMFKEDAALDERGLSALSARMKGLALKFKPAGKSAAAAPPSFLSRPSQQPPAGGWDGTGAAPYDDVDNDGREGSAPNGRHVEQPDGSISNF